MPERRLPRRSYDGLPCPSWLCAARRRHWYQADTSRQISRLRDRTAEPRRLECGRREATPSGVADGQIAAIAVSGSLRWGGNPGMWGTISDGGSHGPSIHGWWRFDEPARSLGSNFPHCEMRKSNRENFPTQISQQTDQVAQVCHITAITSDDRAKARTFIGRQVRAVLVVTIEREQEVHVGARGETIGPITVIARLRDELVVADLLEEKATGSRRRPILRAYSV